MLVTSMASCKSCDEETKSPDAGPPPLASSQADSAPKPPDEPRDAGVAAPEVSRTDAAALIDEPFGDAGTSTCRLAYGPAEQPFRGPAALLVSGQELRLITNDSGKPRVYPVAISPSPKGAPPVVPPRPASFVGMRWPPCELAGRFVYCQGPGGGITRTHLGDRGPLSETTKTIISKSRAGTRLAAAPFGVDHSVVAFLDVRHTTEGDMIQAFVALDEKDPVRLSDDGAGATTMRLLERGDRAIALYLDTRTAMVPIHARPLSVRGADLALGNDVVVHVGGAPERGIDFAAAAVTATKAFVFVPMPRDTIDFGMAAIPIEEPPKEDVPAIWSKYPNGIDPAPIAAAPGRDGKSAWIVRKRPREKAVGSPRILEIGKVDAAGLFTSFGEMAVARNVTDIALVEDTSGGVWILYGDSTITWLERRICPP